VHEITAFPGSKHDDQVDLTAQALAWMRAAIPGWGLFEYYRKMAWENRRGIR